MQLLFPLTSLTLYARECLPGMLLHTLDTFPTARLIMTYFRRNQDLDATLESNTSHTTMNGSAFFKLLALGLFDILLTLPLAILQLVVNILGGNILGFWPGWKVAHASFSTIPTATSEEWKSSGFWTVFGIEVDHWINVIFAVTFFILFGITERKRAWYRSIFWRVMRPLGLKARVDPVASDIVFGSGPMSNPVTVDTQTTAL